MQRPKLRRDLRRTAGLVLAVTVAVAIGAASAGARRGSGSSGTGRSGPGRSGAAIGLRRSRSARARPYGQSARKPESVVSISGAIGEVKLGRSTQAEVLAATGTPEIDAVGNLGAPDVGDYDGLGYECSSQRAPDRTPVGSQGGPHSYCRTVYYIDATTGVLGGFYTSSPRFETSHGTRPGMSSAAAERHERRPALVGCLSGVIESRGGVTLFLGMRGGRIGKARRQDEQPRLIGARVIEISVESSAAPVGNLFC